MSTMKAAIRLSKTKGGVLEKPAQKKRPAAAADPDGAPVQKKRPLQVQIVQLSRITKRTRQRGPTGTNSTLSTRTRASSLRGSWRCSLDYDAMKEDRLFFHLFTELLYIVINILHTNSHTDECKHRLHRNSIYVCPHRQVINNLVRPLAGGGWEFNLKNPFVGEKLTAFETHVKKDGMKCLPRTLAEKAWGSREILIEAMGKGECWPVEVDGVQFIEWRQFENSKSVGHDNKAVLSGGKKVSADEYDMLKDMMFQHCYHFTLTKPEIKQMVKDGEIPDSISERVSKAIVAMEKGFRAAEKSFRTLKDCRDEGGLSQSGCDAMRTLAENIKACAPFVHRYAD